MFQIINKTESVKTETLTVLLYGEPGIGKTSLSFTTNQPILLDFDGGLQRACYRDTAVRISKWEDLQELQNSADFKKIAPKTIIIDTVGSMLDNYLASYVKTLDPKNSRRGGELSLQGYGSIKNNFDQFKNWAKSQKCNLIFIAHTTTMEEGDNTKFIPKVTGGSYDILRQECDLIGYVYSNKNKRVIDFNPCDFHIGKNCAEIPISEIPDYKLPEYATYMQSIIQTTLDRMNSLSEEQTKALEILDNYKNTVIGINTLDEINKALQSLPDVDRALKLQLFELLRQRGTTLGFKYNGKTTLFEAQDVQN